MLFNSFADNSAILRCSCYKEATFYLTINVFGVNNTLFRGKVFFVCMLVKFAGIIYKERLPATRKRFIPHIIINIANTYETVNSLLFNSLLFNWLMDFSAQPRSYQKQLLLYNKHLPYAELLEDESRSLFEDIKQNLSIAVQKKELWPGALYWTNRLTR